MRDAGDSNLHLYSPCPTGWGTPKDSSIELCKLAVETNHFLLWEADHGTVRINYEVDNPKPLGDYIRRLDKYKHVTSEELDELQKRTACRYEMLRSLARRNTPCRV